MNVGRQKKFRKQGTFFAAENSCPDDIVTGCPRMSDDDNRKKDEMTAIQNKELRPGAVPPNASISRKLREFYNAVQEEGIPDRFLDLLERLEQAEKNAKSVNAK
jgi:hypothetical protein